MSSAPSELGSKAAKGAGITLGAQGIRFVLQLLSLTVLARLLTEKDFGLVAMVVAITGIADIVRDFGLSMAAIQSKSLSRQQRDNLVWINVGIATTLALVLLLSTPLVQKLYNEPRVGAIMMVFSALVIVSGLNAQYRADLARSLRFGALAVSDITAQVVSISVAIVAALSGWGYQALVAQLVAFVVVTTLLNIYQCRWVPGLPKRNVPMKQFFSFGGTVFVTQILGYAMSNVDRIALGRVGGPAPSGIYDRANKLLTVPLQQLNAPMARVILPVLSRLQDDDETFAKFVGRFQLVSCYVLGWSFGVGAALSTPLVLVLLGQDWRSVGPVFAVLAIGGIFKAFDQVPYQVYLAKGLTGKLVKYYLISRPLWILVILSGLPWGAIGLATGHLIAAAINWVVSLILMQRWTGVPTAPIFAQAARSLLLVTGPAAAVAYGVAQWSTSLTDLPVVQLIAGSMVAFAVSAVIVLSVPWLRRDFSDVKTAVATIRHRRAAS